MLVFGYLMGVIVRHRCHCRRLAEETARQRPAHFPARFGIGRNAGILLGAGDRVVLGAVLTIAGVGAMTLQVGGRADVLRPQEDEVGFRREPTFRF